MQMKSLIAPVLITGVVLALTAFLGDLLWYRFGTQERQNQTSDGYDWTPGPRANTPQAAISPPVQDTGFKPHVKIRCNVTRGGSGAPVRATYRVLWYLGLSRQQVSKVGEFTGEMNWAVETKRPYVVEFSAEVDGVKHRWGSKAASLDDTIDFGDVVIGYDFRRKVDFLHHDGSPAESVTVSPIGQPDRAVSVQPARWNNHGADYLHPGAYIASCYVGDDNARQELSASFYVSTVPFTVYLPKPQPGVCAIHLTVVDHLGQAKFEQWHTLSLGRVRNGESGRMYMHSTKLELPVEKPDQPLPEKRWCFDGLLPGRYVAEVLTEHDGETSTVFEVSAAKPIVEAVVKLPPPTLVRLTLTRDGKPWANARILSKGVLTVADELGQATFAVDYSREGGAFMEIGCPELRDRDWLWVPLNGLRQGTNDVTLSREELLYPPGTAQLEVEFLGSAFMPISRANPRVRTRNGLVTVADNRQTIHGIKLPFNELIVETDVPGYKLRVPVRMPKPGKYSIRVPLHAGNVRVNVERLYSRPVTGGVGLAFVRIAPQIEPDMWNCIWLYEDEAPLVLAQGEYLLAAFSNGAVKGWNRITVKDNDDVEVHDWHSALTWPEGVPKP